MIRCFAKLRILRLLTGVHILPVCWLAVGMTETKVSVEKRISASSQQVPENGRQADVECYNEYQKLLLRIPILQRTKYNAINGTKCIILVHCVPKDVCQKSTDFNGFWYTKYWLNYAYEVCKLFTSPEKCHYRTLYNKQLFLRMTLFWLFLVALPIRLRLMALYKYVLTDWLIDWLTDWLIDWLIGWQKRYLCFLQVV